MFILDYAHTGNIYWGEGENWDIIAKKFFSAEEGRRKKISVSSIEYKVYYSVSNLVLFDDRK